MIMENNTLFPAFEHNNIPVVLASSNLFAPYAGVFIQSIINCSSTEYNYDIIVMEREISDENKRLLLSLVEGEENFCVRFYNPSKMLPYFHTDTRYPAEIFYRICAPFLLVHYERIVTTGVDIILKKDVAQFFFTDLGECYIGAVRDLPFQWSYAKGRPIRSSINTIAAREYGEKVLKIQDPMDYVNGDVVVYDCKKVRANQNFEDVMCIAKNNTFLSVDQDILNIMMNKKIKFVDLCWNYMILTNHNSNKLIDMIPEKLRLDYEQAGKDPALIHWAGRPKPWVCPDVPLGNEWWEIAKQTPFMGHIIARMFDELQRRREYYLKKYGQEVAVWDPIPQGLKRDIM